MPDYKEMYIELYNAVTKAVEILKQTQINAVEAYFEENARSGEKLDSSFFGKLKSDSTDFKRKE